MGRKSTVLKQPPDVREAIGLWHREHKTLDDILDALDETYGVSISRSALHRHVKGLDKTLARIERSRQLAEATVARFGQEPESKAARANIELAHALISEVSAALDGTSGSDETDADAKGEKPKPMDAMLLAKAIEHLTKASRQDAEMISKIREQARKQIQEEVRARVRALGSAEELKSLSNEELERKIAELVTAA